MPRILTALVLVLLASPAWTQDQVRVASQPPQPPAPFSPTLPSPAPQPPAPQSLPAPFTAPEAVGTPAVVPLYPHPGQECNPPGNCQPHAPCRRCRHCRPGLLAPGEMRARWNNFEAHMRYSHWGYPEYFKAPPLGSSMFAHFGRQVNAGTAAQMVLYRFDFVDGRPQLNPRGLGRLRRLNGIAAVTALPVMVEATANQQLDRARVRTVTELLAAMNGGGTQVVLAAPEHLLNGPDALLIYNNQLKQTTSGDAPIQSGQSGFGPNLGLGTGGGGGGNR